MLFINWQIVVESFWMLVSLSSRQFCARRKDTPLSAAKYSASSLTITQRALALWPVSQRFGHPRVLGIPIPISLAFWASPVGDAQNADHFDFA